MSFTLHRGTCQFAKQPFAPIGRTAHACCDRLIDTSALVIPHRQSVTTVHDVRLVASHHALDLQCLCPAAMVAAGPSIQHQTIMPAGVQTLFAGSAVSCSGT